ncbi:hypothetical protein AGMMS49957_00300 [Synergistales bacterium]|nr:hypothetical protein AGMMS49957_00300 [Synergistales bacterium]
MAGDMFVRLEIIQLRKNPRNPDKEIDPNNSRNYVYSKPIWFGKIKGDAWRDDDASPFKKMGDTTAHIVAPMEPTAGDVQSYRRRGMRVRSWKEAFYGQDFLNLPEVDENTGEANYKRAWFVSSPPPDYPNTDYRGTADAVWTPPIAINLTANNANANATAVIQSGSKAATTFGQYQYVDNRNVVNQNVGRGSVGTGTQTRYAYNGVYTPYIYGRLSLERPQGNNAPLYGLYALQGWDYGFNDNKGAVYDSDANSAKRFLMVVRGMRLPYRLREHSADATTYTVGDGYYKRAPAESTSTYDTYAADRERTFSLRLWISNNGSANIRLYDAWIGEGFTPWEVREVLGLDPNKYPVDPFNPNHTYSTADYDKWRAIRKLYIQGGGDNANGTGNVDNGLDNQLTALQKKGYYVRP